MSEIRRTGGKAASDVEAPETLEKVGKPGTARGPAGAGATATESGAATQITGEELAKMRAKFASAKLTGDEMQRRLNEKMAAGPMTGTESAARAAEAMKQAMVEKAADPEAFHAAMKEIYGANYDEAKVEELRLRAQDGDTSFLPKNVELRDRSEIDGANGAYSPENGGTIYIARDLEDDPAALKTVFQEEAGHHIDALLQLPKGDFDRALAGEDVALADRADARGDEGERLAGFLATGEVPEGAVATEVDKGRIAGGTEVEFEKPGEGAPPKKEGGPPVIEKKVPGAPEPAKAKSTRLPSTVTDERIKDAFGKLPEKVKKLALENAKLKDLASSSARTDRDAALKILELAKQNPKSAEKLLEKSEPSFAALTMLSDTFGDYFTAKPAIQEQIINIIGRSPESAADLKKLLADPLFQRLGIREKVELLKGIAPPPSGKTSSDVIAGIRKDIDKRDDVAKKRAEVAKKLATPGFNPSSLSKEEMALLPPAAQKLITEPSPLIGDYRISQGALFLLLGDKGGSDVLKALDRMGSGTLKSVFDMVADDPGESVAAYLDVLGGFKGASRSWEDIVGKVLDNLDPRAQGIFVRGLSDAVATRIGTSSVLGAVIAGFTIGGEIGKEPLKGTISFSPAKLVEVLGQNANTAAAGFLQRILSRLKGGGSLGGEEAEEFQAALGQ